MADPATIMLASALVGGGSKLMGSLINSISESGHWDVDPGLTRGAVAQSPDRDPYGGEADAAAGRINDISNPFVGSALGDQESMAAMQESYLDDLLSVAQGDKSYVQEQADRDLAHQKSGLLGEANSTRDRFSMGSQRAQATQLASAAQQNMAAPTTALKAQEQERARQMLAQGYGQADDQGSRAFQAWLQQRTDDEAQAAKGEGAAAGHFGLGSFDKIGDITREVNWEAIRGIEDK